MKWIGFFLFVSLLLAACGPGGNEVDIAQAQSIIEAARAAQDAARAAQIAAQGMSDVGRGQVMFLILLAFTVTLLVLLGTFVLVTHLTRQMYRSKIFPSKGWVSGPNARWKRIEQPDLTQQMLLQQQWLTTQLLSQSLAEPKGDDQPQLPTDWWE